MGCAPFASHALMMAGAFRLDCFAMGSHQPSSCAFGRWGRNGKFPRDCAARRYKTQNFVFLFGGRMDSGAKRTSRGAPSRRLRESMAIMR